ncbi:MAG TPA: DUF6600 domain-containing protein [Ramlibacter sp.]|nr:DUF6600 domain-containing protein [Ramlibacter sp.]
MKSRHMRALPHRRLWRSLPWLAGLALLLWTAAAAFAQQPEAHDPPGRVASITYRQGGLVFAPAGDEEWVALPRNRPLTDGDRLWTDRGARAEIHLGDATLHIDGESHLGIRELDDRSANFLLMQGALNARVRGLVGGESFEIATPNLAAWIQQAGDYRIDVEPGGRETRVAVLSGLVTLHGQEGQSMTLAAGQQASFTGRSLAQVQGEPYRGDAFGQWAAERNRAEDQSMAARYLPRGVVGYSQLDPYGSWSLDPTYGAVWYPQVLVADWAPYRYGHWAWIAPWGWTWIDDAPWGFAPFHYGRWIVIGSRWAWVPGRLVARPVYAPALVVFIGGGGSFLVGSGPGVGWCPLAPGEAWLPWYRTSPRYLSYANYAIDVRTAPRHPDFYRHRQWLTALREDDFRRGRRVNEHWQRVQPAAIGQAQIGWVPARPERRREAAVAPQLQVQPRVSGVQPALRFERPRSDQPRFEQPRQEQPRFRQDQPRFAPPGVARERDRAEREQERAQREQERVRGDQDRAQREQERVRGDRERAQGEQERVRGDQDRAQREQERARGDQDRARQDQDRAVREQQRAQREQQRLQGEAERNARQQQRLQEEQARNRMQEAQARQQQEAQRRQQEAARQQNEAVRQQHEAARQQERAQREAWQREHGVRAVEPRAAAPQPQAAPIGRAPERAERGEGPRDQGRGEGRRQREDDGPGRGRGRGQDNGR